VEVDENPLDRRCVGKSEPDTQRRESFDREGYACILTAGIGRVRVLADGLATDVAVCGMCDRAVGPEDPPSEADLGSFDGSKIILAGQRGGGVGTG
jgi:hypothetical protein